MTLRASMHWHYFQVCRDHIKLYETIEQDISRLQKSSEEGHIIEMNVAAAHARREQAVVVPIIFAAMCLEAFIFDYGARHRSGSYVGSHIDKLEVPSKLVVLTELVTGKAFPTGSQAFKRLKQLITDRNKLVHFKSKDFSDGDLAALGRWHEEMNRKLKSAMYNAHEAVVEVMRELDDLHGNQTKYYETYITDAECHA